MSSRPRLRQPARTGIASIAIPSHFQCPISLDLMKDPVTLPTGITYDRPSIERWLDMGHRTCPVTGMPLTSEEEMEEDLLVPNHSIRRMIQNWCVANRSHGIQRLPTPKIPVSPARAGELLTEVAAVCRQGDQSRCRELVATINMLAKESERNRRCFAETGAAWCLCTCFQLCSDICTLEQILSVLTSLFPLDEEALQCIGSPESMSLIISTLKSGSLAGRLSAALAVKELVSTDKTRAASIAGAKGLTEALAKLVKEPVSPQTTKASLVAIYFLVSSGEKTAIEFAEMNLVTTLIEMLVDAERSTSEKALAVLDGILSCEIGRENAVWHALATPVLVKKMLRVSDMATEFAISALWKLCRKKEESGMEAKCFIEALQVGAFQKLLLVLQIGCSEGTKEKASELLKMMNGYRGGVEWCIDGLDFKGLKRPF